MRIRSRRLLAVLVGAGLVAAACSGSSTPAPASDGGASPSEAASAAPSTAGPFTATLKDGSTFTLKQSIADKIAAGEPINYLFSYQSSSIPLFSDQYKIGYETGVQRAQATYPLNGTIVAPAAPTGDINEQIAQIEAQVSAGNADCVSIEPATSDGFTAITNKLMAEGIPVFTVGVTSNGNEFTNFTQVPMKEGKKAAEVLLDWMQKEGKQLKVFAVSGGDPTQFWAQGRMQSFRETIQAAIPDAKFINTEANGLATTYDPAATYDAYKAFITGNPDVEFIENVDIGAEHANRAIKDLGKVGQTFTLGWNVSYGQLDGIKEGIQVTALDQQWSEQAAFGAVACVELLKNGNILPNTQELSPITAENEAAARAELDKILKK